jgi:hypothetical protein
MPRGCANEFLRDPKVLVTGTVIGAALIELFKLRNSQLSWTRGPYF